MAWVYRVATTKDGWNGNQHFRSVCGCLVPRFNQHLWENCCTQKSKSDCLRSTAWMFLYQILRSWCTLGEASSTWAEELLIFSRMLRWLARLACWFSPVVTVGEVGIPMSMQQKWNVNVRFMIGMSNIRKDEWFPHGFPWFWPIRSDGFLAESWWWTSAISIWQWWMVGMQRLIVVG